MRKAGHGAEARVDGRTGVIKGRVRLGPLKQSRELQTKSGRRIRSTSPFRSLRFQLRLGASRSFVSGATLEPKWVQPPYAQCGLLPIPGRNTMSTGLGDQLSCCLAVKPLLTLTGSTKHSRKGGEVNTERILELGQALSLTCACPCSHLMHMASV